MESSKHRILVIEDHADTRELLTLALADYKVTTASTIDEATRLVDAGNFSLLMLDSRLPDGSGVDFCRQVRQLDGQTPIVFCSGLAYEEDRRNAFSAGAQAYFVKPVDLAQLVSRIGDLITKVGPPPDKPAQPVDRKPAHPTRIALARHG